MEGLQTNQLINALGEEIKCVDSSYMQKVWMRMKESMGMDHLPSRDVNS
jgi:hypothetical protein